MLLPGSYLVATMLLAMWGRQAIGGLRLALGVGWDWAELNPKGIASLMPSPFLQPSPREVALQILAAWDILVRFEVECARGADTNVGARAPGSAPEQRGESP